MRLLKSGEVIFHQGEPGDAMYILMEGRVELTKTFDDGKKPITIGETTEESETSWFGEVALTKPGGKRGATGTCTEPSKVLVVDKEHFRAFEEIVPKFGVEVHPPDWPRTATAALEEPRVPFGTRLSASPAYVAGGGE